MHISLSSPGGTQTRQAMGQLYVLMLDVNGDKFTFLTVQPFALRRRDGSRQTGLRKPASEIFTFPGGLGSIAR